MWIFIPLFIFLIFIFVLVYPLSYIIHIDNKHVYFKCSYLFGMFSKEYEKDFSDILKGDEKSNEYDENEENVIADNEILEKNTKSIEKNEEKDIIKSHEEKEVENEKKQNSNDSKTLKNYKKESTFMEKLRFAIKNGTFKIVLKTLKEIYYVSKPQEFNISGKIGLGNPAETGISAGILYATFADIANSIEWNYSEKIFELKVMCKGSIIPFKALWIIGKTVISTPVREFLSYVKGED